MSLTAFNFSLYLQLTTTLLLRRFLIFEQTVLNISWLLSIVPEGKLLALDSHVTLDKKKKSSWLDVRMSEMSMAAMEEGVKNSSCVVAIITDSCEDINAAIASAAMKRKRKKECQANLCDWAKTVIPVILVVGLGFEGTSCTTWSKCVQGKYGNTPTTSANRVCTNCEAGQYQSSNDELVEIDTVISTELNKLQDPILVRQMEHEVSIQSDAVSNVVCNYR